MKKKLAFLIISTIFLSGCTQNNFFDIQTLMNPPKFSENEEKLTQNIKNYLGGEFIWSYQLINDRYYSIMEHNFNNNIYKIMFCKMENNPITLHILFLDKNNKIIGEIILLQQEFQKIYLKDINDDGIDEILIYKQKKENLIEIYSLNELGIIKIES